MPITYLGSDTLTPALNSNSDKIAPNYKDLFRRAWSSCQRHKSTHFLVLTSGGRCCI